MCYFRASKLLITLTKIKFTKLHQKELLIGLEYLGSINYYRLLMQYDKVWLEQHENFVKSSYRNRCYITGPNGILMLSIPVKGGKSHRQQYIETQIDYESREWQKIHWKSFCAAYRRSPFFEYYEDAFHPFYHKHFNTIFDYNWQLMQLIIKLVGLDITIGLTDEYEKAPTGQIDDYRMTNRPNSPALDHLAVPDYQQVFIERTGFIPHLSIVDLLFNLGPETKTALLL